MNSKNTGLLISTCILSTLSMLLVFSLVAFIYISKSQIKALENEIESLSVFNSEQSYEDYALIDRISRARSRLYAEKYGSDSEEYYGSAGSFFAMNACIVTPSGEKYHRLHCSHISDTESYMIFNVKTAELFGYGKCSDCY